MAAGMGMVLGDTVGSEAAPCPEHAGVWVCHSLVSKLISGSLTRGKKIAIP